MVDKVVSNTTSGSVLINDAVTHVGNLNLPFGGVGPSGMGAYHGKFSFDEFTHLRPVMFKGLSMDADRYPPYSHAKVKLIQKLQGLGDEPLIPKWLPKAGMYGSFDFYFAGIFGLLYATPRAPCGILCLDLVTMLYGMLIGACNAMV